jgi:S-adenosylmethionine:tRNA ribosyltransferase-isomerase
MKTGNFFRFAFSDEPHTLMQKYGHVPLPPYITHTDSAEDERTLPNDFCQRTRRSGGSHRGFAL